MTYIEIFTAVVFFCLSSSMTRLFQLKIWGAKPSIRLFQACFCLVASIAYSISCRGNFSLSTLSLCLAVFFGMLFTTAVYMSSRCLECGPMSLTSVITNMSLSIPIIYSLAVFGEVPTLLRVAGLVLMIATFVISALGKTGNGNGRVSTVWIICVIIAFFANGITAVLQKQNAMHKGDNTSFLALAYFVAFVCFFGIFLVENKGQRFKWSENFKCGAAVVPITFLAGIGSFVGNGLLGSLSTRVDATILYPCINGGLALMSSAVSFLFFKEKFSAVKALSMAVGISAIILLTV